MGEPLILTLTHIQIPACLIHSFNHASINYTLIMNSYKTWTELEGVVHIK